MRTIDLLLVILMMCGLIINSATGCANLATQNVTTNQLHEVIIDSGNQDWQVQTDLRLNPPHEAIPAANR